MPREKGESFYRISVDYGKDQTEFLEGAAEVNGSSLAQEVRRSVEISHRLRDCYIHGLNNLAALREGQIPTTLNYGSFEGDFNFLFVLMEFFSPDLSPTLQANPHEVDPLTYITLLKVLS